MPTFDELVSGAPAFPPLEDIVLRLLKPLEGQVTGLKVGAWIPVGVTLPYILVRREGHAFASESFGSRDPRFCRRAVFAVQTFTEDLDDGNGDARGAALSDVAYRRLMTAVRTQEVVPGYGHLTTLRSLDPPVRQADWATSTGVVQYANLPKGCHRYDARYGTAFMADLDNPIDPLALLN